MRVITTIPQAKLGPVPAAVRTIEETGYDGIVTLENQHDALLAVAAVSSPPVRTRKPCTKWPSGCATVPASQALDLLTSPPFHYRGSSHVPSFSLLSFRL